MKTSLFFILCITCIISSFSQDSLELRKQEFENLKSLEWKQQFFDACSKDWTKKWFLDGERAWVKNTPDGMVFSGGPIERDNGSHGVLWTNDNFVGDIKIEYDYTRLDNINNAVNIIYIQATGRGDAPYVKDIEKWKDLRIVPKMGNYFVFMNALHISYAAYDLGDAKDKKDYVRARRYPVAPGEKFTTYTALKEEYENTGLFKPGIVYHFTIIKKGTDIYFEVKNDKDQKLFYFSAADFEPITEGRVGLRHMWTRCSRYANVSISTL